MTTTLSAQATLAVRFRCPPFELGSRVPEALGRVGDVMTATGAAAAGPGYTRYTRHDPDAGVFDVEVGIPVRDAVRGADGVEASALPGGAAVLVWHEGPYGTLGQSFLRLQGDVAAQALTPAGPPWESYVVGPGQESDAAKWRTALYQPVREPNDRAAGNRT